jgi:hypothetical protein
VMGRTGQFRPIGRLPRLDRSPRRVRGALLLASLSIADRASTPPPPPPAAPPLPVQAQAGAGTSGADATFLLCNLFVGWPVRVAPHS